MRREDKQIKLNSKGASIRNWHSQRYRNFFYNAITTIKIVPLNFFNSSISGDVLTPGIYMPQLFSCVSKLLLHGRSDHFGCDTIFVIIAANCFSIRNDDGKHSQNEVGEIISFKKIYRLTNLSSPPFSVSPSPLDYP